MRGVAVRTLNVRLAVILIVAAVVMLVGIFYLHKYQMWRNAYVYKDAGQRSLERAKKAAEDGDTSAENNEYREALRDLRLYLVSRPDDVEVYEQFAMLSADRATLPDRPRDARSLTRAFGALEHVLLMDPDRTAVRRRLVDVAMTMRRYQDARDHLEKVLLKKSPDDPELLRLYGRCQAAMGDDTQAVETFKKAIEHAPEEVDLYPRLAEILRVRFSRAKEADQWMEKLVTANPRSAKAHLLRSGYLSGVGQADDALSEALQSLQLATDALSQSPQSQQLADEHSDALRLAAKCSLAKGETQLAREYAERGTELYPKNVVMYSTVADVELQLRNYDKAIQVLEKGLEATQRSPYLLDTLAQVLIDAGQLDRAQETIKELQKSPQYPRDNISFLECRMAFVQGHWLAARQGFEKLRNVLATMPGLAKQVDTWIAECYGAVGDYDQEVQACRRALAIDPFFPPARAVLIKGLQASGHSEEAFGEYAQLAKLGRLNVESALDLVRMITVATLRQDPAKRNWEPAERTLDQVDQMLPNSPKSLILRAEILVGQDRIADAQRLLEEAYEKNPKKIELLATLVSLASRQGDWAKAEELLEEMQTLQGDCPELRLAQSNYLRRRYGKDAVERLHKLAEDTGDFSTAQLVRLWYGLLGDAIQIDDTEQCKVLCQRIAEQEPTNVQIRYLLFEEGMKLKDDAVMDKALAEVEQMAGQTAQWLYSQAVRQLERGRGKKDANAIFDQGLSYLAKAHKLRPTWSRIPLLTGEFYYRQGKWNEALKNFQEAIDAGERDPAAIQKAVRILFQQQRYADANQLLQRLEGQQLPFSAELTRQVAESALYQGKFERALEMARKAASEKSENYQDHLWLGQVLSVVSLAAKAGDKSADTETLLAQAEKSLRRAIELEPRAPDAWVALVQFLSSHAKSEQVAETIAEAGKNIPAEKAPLALAQCYERAGNVAAAQEQWEIALAAAPADPAVIRSVADFYVQTGKLEPAETLLRKITEGTVESSAADTSLARRQLATILSRRGPYANLVKARELLDKNLAADERSLPDRRAVAALDALDPSRARHEEAVRILEGIVSEQSDTVQDRFHLAQFYLALGSWAKASAQFRNVLISYGSDSAVLRAYIVALLQHDEISNAEMYLDRLEKLAPGELSTISLRATTLALKNDLDRAIGLLNGCIDRTGVKPADPNERRRRVAEEMQQLSEQLNKPGQEAAADRCARRARVLFEACVKEDPKQTLAFVTFLGRQNDLDSALDLLEKTPGREPKLLAQVCLSLLSGGKANQEQLRRLDRILEKTADSSDDSGPLLLTLAMVRARQSRYADAEKLYREVLAKDRDNAAALNNLAVLLALQDVKLDEALKLVNQAIDVAGPMSAMLDSRAIVYTALGQPKEALKDLDEAIADKEQAVWLFHQARAYEKAGQRSSASAVMQKALKKGLAPSMLEALEVPAFDKLRNM